jgi:predicted phage terminase large subunit-like protein
MNITREEKEEMLRLLLEKERRMYSNNFYEFFMRAWKEVDPHTTLEDNWHISYLCYIAERLVKQVVNKEEPDHKTVLINICPRSLKSWIFNVALPAWIWTLEPTAPIITASYSEVLALGFSRKSQQIMRTKWFKSLYGDQFSIEQSEGGREAVGETQTSKGGVRFCTSVGGTIVGKGMLVGVIDDPIKPSEAREEKALQKNIDFWSESYETRRNNPKKSISFIIMQRVSEGDLSGYLIENYSEDPDFLHINLPIIANGSEKIPYLDDFLLWCKDNKYKIKREDVYKRSYFFGDRFDESFIRQQQKKGAVFYATQYLMNPSPREGIMFKRDWFPVIPKEDFDKIKRKEGAKFKKTFVTDTAFTDNTLNDPSAILGYSVIGNTIYLTDYFRDHVDGARLPQWIHDCVMKAGYDNKSLITIEPKASGKIVVSLLKANSKLNVVEYAYPKAAKVNINLSKETRAEAITSQVESGRVVIVEGNWNELFINEVVTFPISKTDEAIDCLVQAVLRAHYVDSRYKKFGLKKIN